MKYTCYDDLKNNILKQGDCVQFKINGRNEYLIYTVQYRYLMCNNGDNNTVFDLLNINARETADEYYGYKSTYGSWPEFVHDDYEAATRLVLKLYEIIEKDTSIKKQNNKDNILIPAKKYKQTNKIPENTEITLTI